MEKGIVEQAKKIFSSIGQMETPEKIATINQLRIELSKHSPFKSEPVDCVTWIPMSKVEANDYNPNSVAPPEMELLRRSIGEDGYTQPIVAWRNNGMITVVDGFHRNRVGREYEEIKERTHGHLPVTIINAEREDRGDRIASTIRHNRARGKHKVEAMSDIVIELKRRNWSDAKIGRELGMDADEVLRLTQITGLAEMFSDKSFSEAWEASSGDVINEDDNLIDEEESGTDISSL